MGKPPIVWDDPAARDELVSVLVEDATALLDAPGYRRDHQDRWEACRGGRVARPGGRAGRGAGRGLDGTHGRCRIALVVAALAVRSGREAWHEAKETAPAQERPSTTKDRQ